MSASYLLLPEFEVLTVSYDARFFQAGVGRRPSTSPPLPLSPSPPPMSLHAGY